MKTLLKVKIKESDSLNDTWLAPYAGYVAFIVDHRILILDGEVHEDFEYDNYKKHFEIEQSFD